MALWFGFISIPSQKSVGFVIIGVGLIFAMYLLAGFSGGAEPADVGFRAAVVALLVALALLMIGGATDIDLFSVAAPIAGAGTGASLAIPPAGDVSRIVTRVSFVVALAMILYWVWGVDSTVYGATAPLFVFTVVGIADIGYERSRQVLAEE